MSGLHVIEATWGGEDLTGWDRYAHLGFLREQLERCAAEIGATVPGGDLQNIPGDDTEYTGDIWWTPLLRDDLGYLVGFTRGEAPDMSSLEELEAYVRLPHPPPGYAMDTPCESDCPCREEEE